MTERRPGQGLRASVSKAIYNFTSAAVRLVGMGTDFSEPILTGCRTAFWSKPVSDTRNRFKSPDSAYNVAENCRTAELADCLRSHGCGASAMVVPALCYSV
jgi:hypothetical protein